MSKPTHFAVALFPCFQLLDLTGPLDILNMLSYSVERTDSPSLTLTILSDTLDPVPTKPIPPRDATWRYDVETSFAIFGGKAATSFNQYLVPDATYQDYLDGKGKHPIDVLLIPGGLGSRMNRIDLKTDKATNNVGALMDFLPRIAPSINYAIVTVCTGSDILAQTGLLNKRRATTNINWFDKVKSRSPAVDWQSYARWCFAPAIEKDSSENGEKSPEIWTSAGISAGIDVTLAFISHYWSLELARGFAKSLEYEWREVAEGEVDPLYHRNGTIDS